MTTGCNKILVIIIVTNLIGLISISTWASFNKYDHTGKSENTVSHKVGVGHVTEDLSMRQPTNIYKRVDEVAADQMDFTENLEDLSRKIGNKIFDNLKSVQDAPNLPSKPSRIKEITVDRNGFSENSDVGSKRNINKIVQSSSSVQTDSNKFLKPLQYKDIEIAVNRNERIEKYVGISGRNNNRITQNLNSNQKDSKQISQPSLKIDVASDRGIGNFDGDSGKNNNIVEQVNKPDHSDSKQLSKPPMTKDVAAHRTVENNDGRNNNKIEQDRKPVQSDSTLSPTKEVKTENRASSRNENTVLDSVKSVQSNSKQFSKPINKVDKSGHAGNDDGNSRKNNNKMIQNPNAAQKYSVQYLKSLLNKQIGLGSTNSPRNACNCNLKTNGFQTQQLISTCSYEATQLGGDQRVISFSLYSKFGSDWALIETQFFDGILDNLALMKKYYPSYVMRVYTNQTLTPSICGVVCADEDLYFCNATHLPVLGNVNDIDPRTWRFLVLGDPTVEKFLSRDLDSRMCQREKDAVVAWDKSEYPFHAMRDHPKHTAPIMAGLWGGNNQRLDENIRLSLQRELLDAKNRTKNEQNLLSQILYNPYKDKILIHDSYLCYYFRDSVAFPTKRQHRYVHVGRQFNNPHRVARCPWTCRPKYEKHWRYC